MKEVSNVGGLHPDLQAKEQALAVTYSNHNRAEGTFVPSLIAVETGYYFLASPQAGPESLV